MATTTTRPRGANMSTRKPRLRHILYTTGMCTLSVAVFACMRLAGQHVEPAAQNLPLNKSITVRPATPNSSTSESGKRPSSMGAGQNGRASSADLPDGPPVPVRGTDTWHVVPLAQQRSSADGSYTYSIEIEDGVLLAEGDKVFGRFVEEVLDDPRSW